MLYEVKAAPAIPKLRLVWWLPLIAGLLLFPSQPLIAQATYDSVAFLGDGQVWVWRVGDTYPTQVTHFSADWDIYSRSISPNGRYVAVGTRSYVMDSLNQYVDYQREKIWLYDLATGELWDIDGRPAAQDREQDQRIAIGYPIFAPDSSEVQWVQVDAGANYEASLIFYDPVRRARRSIPGVVALGYQDGGLNLPIINWSNGGLLHWYPSYGADDQFHQFLNIYEPIIGTTKTFDIWREDMGDDQIPNRVVWAQAGGKAVIALERDGLWTTLDAADGTLSSYDTPPVRRAVGFALTTSVTEIEGETVYRTDAQTAAGVAVVLPDGASVGAVSTGGGAILFSGAGFNGVWQDGDVHLFDPPLPWRGEASGARAIYTFETAPTGSQPTLDFTTYEAGDYGDCTLSPRLRAGQNALIIPGQGANALRTLPGRHGVILTAIVEGRRVRVLDGPVCRYGYYWWEVDYDGQIGWTAEGDPQTGEYWLEVVQEAGE